MMKYLVFLTILIFSHKSYSQCIGSYVLSYQNDRFQISEMICNSGLPNFDHIDCDIGFNLALILNRGLGPINPNCNDFSLSDAKKKVLRIFDTSINDQGEGLWASEESHYGNVVKNFQLFRNFHFIPVKYEFDSIFKNEFSTEERELIIKLYENKGDGSWTLQPIVNQLLLKNEAYKDQDIVIIATNAIAFDNLIAHAFTSTSPQIIIGLESVLSNDLVLTHEIYHTLNNNERFKDQDTVGWDVLCQKGDVNSSNIMNKQSSFCNMFLDPEQLFTLNNSDFTIAHTNFNDISFPYSESCFCSGDNLSIKEYFWLLIFEKYLSINQHIAVPADGEFIKKIRNEVSNNFYFYESMMTSVFMKSFNKKEFGKLNTFTKVSVDQFINTRIKGHFNLIADNLRSEGYKVIRSKK